MTENNEVPTEGAPAVTSHEMVLLSACLMGRKCAYDGGSAKEEISIAEDHRAAPVCPEVMGGLSTPRTRAEIVGGNGFDVLDGRARVLTQLGEDVTEAYLAGAQDTLRVARKTGASSAVLQDYSPSCGCRLISDGSFRRSRVEGVGVTAALLLRNGIKVIAHHEYGKGDHPTSIDESYSAEDQDDGGYGSREGRGCGRSGPG
jgi:uncharacterized protein YbbK (DUF523 family)